MKSEIALVLALMCSAGALFGGAILVGALAEYTTPRTYVTAKIIDMYYVESNAIAYKLDNNQTYLSSHYPWLWSPILKLTIGKTYNLAILDKYIVAATETP